MASSDYGKDFGPGSAQAMAAQEAERAKNEQRRIEELKKQGLNPDGSPIRPEFQSLIDPATGLLKQPYQLHAQPDIQVDQRAINEIRDRALSKDPSAWAKMALDKQKIEETDAQDTGAQRQAGSQAQAANNLMMNGGLSSGARERMASQGSLAQMMAGNQIARQGQLDRSNIGLQDQQQKNEFLKMVPQLDFANADIGMKNRDYSTNVSRNNIAASLADVEAKRNYDMGVYSEGMKKWAAGKSADAQAAAGHGKK